MGRTILRFALAVLLLVCSSTTALSLPPTAALSWDPDSLVASHPSPLSGPTRVYVQLSGVPDDAAIGLKLGWTPVGSPQGGYQIAPDADSTQLTGRATSATLVDSLCGLGDYWTVAFPPGESHDRISFVVAPEPDAAALPATICITSALLRSSSGEVTRLLVTGCASLLGGSEPCPSAVYRVSPHAVVSGQATEIALSGFRLSPVAALSVDVGGTSTALSGLSVINDSLATAQAPAGMPQGNATLIVTNAYGASDTLAGALSIVPPPPTYVGNQILLGIRPSSITVQRDASTGWGLGTPQPDAGLSALMSSAGVESLTALPEMLSSPIPEPSVVCVATLRDTNVTAALVAFRADTADVLSADRNWIYYPTEVIPQIYGFAEQWWLKNRGRWRGTVGADAGITRAWDFSTGGVPDTVAVLDTGVDSLVPGLRGRVINQFPMPNYDPTAEDADFAHGTSVAGIIAAAGNGTSPVAGVDWTARVRNLKVSYGTTGATDDATTQAALTQLSYSGIKVANMSYDAPLANATQGTNDKLRSLYSEGAFIAVSAGNDGSVNSWPPSCYAPYTTSVGAFSLFGWRWRDRDFPWDAWGTKSDSLWDGSSHGPALWILAPGGRFIQTTTRIPGGNYCFVIDSTKNHNLGFGGTSAAAPVVAGAAALLRSSVPDGREYTGEDIRTLLKATADYHLAPNDPVSYPCLNVERLITATRDRLRYHGVATTGHVSNVLGGLHTTVMSWDGIPYGHYCNAIRYTVDVDDELPEALSSPPLWWSCSMGSAGAGSVLPSTIYDIGHAPLPTGAWEAVVDTIGAELQRVHLRTWVYHLTDASDPTRTAWWPCDTSSVRCAYTCLGMPTRLLGVTATDRATGLWLECTPNLSNGQRIKIALGRGLGAMPTVSVFDVQGRRVRRLEVAADGPDGLRADWDLALGDGNRARPGVYFVRGTWAQRSAQRRVLVLW